MVVSGARRRRGAYRAYVSADGGVRLGPEYGAPALTSAELPDIVLPDRHGREFALSSLRGRKALLVTWASWCGCRFDLSGWRKLREELHPRGLEVVSVALDTGGADAA